MSWKTDLAIKRIFNSFKRLKKQIYTQDIESLKHLNNVIQESEKAYVNDNLLYAKLLCYVLDKNLHNHGSMKIAIKEVDNILKQPLNYHLQMLHQNLNNHDFINYLKEIGTDFDSYARMNIDKEKHNEIIEMLNKNWSFEKVEHSFYNTSNDFLKDLNNYV